MVTKLAFITSREDPLLIADDRLAIEPLLAHGFSVAPHVWDDDTGTQPDIEQFDALVFRSCWNYHRNLNRFRGWLESLRYYQKPVLNPIDVNLWNLSKSYLFELAAKGAPVPRCESIAKATALDSPEVKAKIASLDTDQIVIRPTVSLNGYDTYLVDRNDPEQLTKIWRSMPVDRDILVQEFVPEIYSSGETSLIFFNGEFSHAIKKTPMNGEFRVHEQYGGTRTPVTPDVRVIEAAKTIINLISYPLLFARVDVVERPAGPLLVEFEILDPMLYLGYAIGAPERFARAIARRMTEAP